MLAQATGTYCERPVVGPLRDHFVCAWAHRLPMTETPPVVVVPDGCIDLQWLAGTWRIAGPDREAIVETLAPGTTVAGLSLPAGRCFLLAGTAGVRACQPPHSAGGILGSRGAPLG